LSGTSRLAEEAKTISRNDFCVQIVPNWIDCEVFIPQNKKKDYDIICVGRLAHEKNHLLLLSAVGRFQKNSRQSLRVIFIGNGETKESIEKFARESRIDLLIMDNISNEKIPDYLNRSRVFLLTSKHEGSPKALLEAMACGIPVVGTAVRGIADIITSAKNGLLCPEDPDKIAEAIDLLFSDEVLSGNLAAEARDFVLRNYSFPTVMEKITFSLK
jgi:glycosyltransferase involved in cell wall biosynthesis